MKKRKQILVFETDKQMIDRYDLWLQGSYETFFALSSGDIFSLLGRYPDIDLFILQMLSNQVEMKNLCSSLKQRSENAFIILTLLRNPTMDYGAGLEFDALLYRPFSRIQLDLHLEYATSKHHSE